MAAALKVKPSHKPVKSYYAALATCADQSVEHEGTLRSAFQNLLAETGRKVAWTLIPKLSLDANGHHIRPDGTFRDDFTIDRGYWEAKDTDDDLEAEIKNKIKRGYRLTNAIFDDTREARLYQDGKLDMIANLRDPQQLCDLLNAFFSHTEPAHEDFNKTVDEFKQRFGWNRRLANTLLKTQTERFLVKEPQTSVCAAMIRCEKHALPSKRHAS